MAAAARVLLAGVSALAFAAMPASLSAAAGELPQGRRVLLLQSFGHEFAPFSEYATYFRPALAGRSGEPIDFFDVSLHGARHPYAVEAEPFLRYLANIFADRPPDLVVPIGGPAVRFAQAHRDRLFPSAPMLLAGSDRRVVRDEMLGPRDVVAAVRFDFARTVSDILAVLPKTTRLAVVLGDSAIERYWVEEFRRDLRPFADRLELVWFNGITFDELKRRAAALPPDSAILLALFSVDAAGVSHRFDQVLREIHAVSSAPIFGFFETQLGMGIVGGRLMSTQVLARNAAELVSGVLRGGATGPPGLPPLEPGAPVYDERELRRWRIDEALLPAGSVVQFRARSTIARYGRYLAVAAAAVVLQTAMIAALLAQRRRRRRAETEALALSGQLITAYEDERRRLGRELHDDVSQRLARLAIDAGRIERAGRDREDAGAAREMREELARLSEDVHALSYRLHPSVIEDLGLVEAIRAECDNVARREPIRVETDAPELAGKPPREAAVCLFRVMQEALRNAVRHARASAVRVSLAPRDGGLVLVVADNGVGFDGASGRPSLGQASMRERVRLLGGRFEVRSAPGRGTTVTAWVPLAETPA
ncbi:MAG: sensor histidine kinase [Burkholderiales bacterium]|nr:sensor histidine kinase [Burkholderiales bacterium]